jgi:hypothetical protein
MDLSRPNMPWWYGDSNLWAVAHDVAWFILEQGEARYMPGSSTAVVPYPEQLQAGTTIIQELADGSAVVGGSGGDCDSISAVCHSDFVLFANRERIGFEFASGFLWEKSKTSGLMHSPAFIIDEDEQLWLMEPKRPRDTFLITPEGITTYMLYN